MMLKLKRMDYIKPYIGLKVNLRMKMVLKRLKDGLLIRNMLGIGKIILNLDLEFNIMEMAINMKVVGKIPNAMVKEHIGLLKERINYVENIQVIGLMIRKLGKELCFILMGIDLMDYGKMINNMEKEE